MPFPSLTNFCAMHYRKFPIRWAFLFLLINPSCTTDKNSNISLEEISFISTEEIEQLDIQNYVSKSRYIPIALPEDQPFYTADKIQAGDGKFFLGDIELENTVLIVDEEGKFIHQIFTGGNGPGEIPRFEDFIYHPDRNSLLFLMGRKIFEFSTTGEFLNLIALPANEVFHFIAYGGENQVWLYTLPPPFSGAETKDIRLLSLIDLEKGTKVDSLLSIPEGRIAQVSGTKELSFQNGNVVFAPAFGTSVYTLDPLEENLAQKKYLSFAQTDNFYGLPGLDAYFERLQDERSLAFADNYVDLGDHALFFIYKNGMSARWGAFDRASQNLTLAEGLVDGELNLPLVPYLDVQGRQVFRLLDSEFFDQIEAQDEEGLVTDRLRERFPDLMKMKTKMLLCVYEV
ncbi:hypothetical protein DDT91_09610 [Algoriphagus sp. AK58]|nr:hypothetical protein [Algoriphagus sp. AK58]